MAAVTVLRKDTCGSVRSERELNVKKKKPGKVVEWIYFGLDFFVATQSVFPLLSHSHKQGHWRRGICTRKLRNTALHHLVYTVAIVLMIMIMMVVMITSFICHNGRLMINTLNDGDILMYILLKGCTC